MLRRGELFGIFPEGTRSRDGYLYKGRTGAARLAMKLGCPIFPVGIIGTDEIQPPDAKVPKPFRDVHDQDRPADHAGALPRPAAERIVWRSMTDEVMFEIRELTGQEYRNVYAGQQPDTGRRGAGQGRHRRRGRRSRPATASSCRSAAADAGRRAGNPSGQPSRRS